MEPMYVICFYWKGERWNTSADDAGNTDPAYLNHMRSVGDVDNSLASEYVNKLYRGVKRYANREFDFICFTNEDLQVEEGVELRRFPLHTTTGVLPRLYMFAEEAELLKRQVLCLDLDVVIVGDLSSLMNYTGQFCTRSKFREGEQHKLDGDIMSFRAGEENTNRFWKPFIKDPKLAEKMTMGRERYWVRMVASDIAERWDVIAPGTVLSYKKHILKEKKVPENAVVISCHGYPRPHQIKERWIKKYWV